MNSAHDKSSVENQQTAVPVGERLQVPVALSFEFDSTAGILYAVLTPAEHPQQFDQNGIEKQLAALGYQDFFRNADALDLLRTRMEAGCAGKLEFSRKLDAAAVIDIAEDKMQAHITTQPAYGGAALDYLKIMTALKTAGIAACFYEGDVIPALINGSPLTAQLLAAGVPAVNGSDGKLISLVQETTSKEAQEDSHGHIDPHHELNQFIVVEAGAALMRLEPATPGVDGYDVCGNVLMAKLGKLANFSTKLSGAGVDPKDPNLLVALIKGHPILLPSAVKVDPVLRLQEVGIKTGNINFDGTVRVEGDVHTGMVIQASGSVHINGMVEKATIISGNDITITGGIVGGDSHKDVHKHGSDKHETDSGSDQHSHGFKCLLKAGGSIKAKYINHAEIDCGGDLVVSEYLMHSTANVSGHLRLGQKGGKGCLIGGCCHATAGVTVNMLGNEHNMKTSLSIGFSRSNLTRFSELSLEQEKHLSVLVNLKEGLSKMQALVANGNLTEELQNKIVKMQQAIEQISAELETLDTEQQSLQEQLAASKLLKVSVTQKTFPNVFVCINGHEFRTEIEHGNGYFQQHNGRVKFSK
jgi:uncharacterized protein